MHGVTHTIKGLGHRGDYHTAHCGTGDFTHQSTAYTIQTLFNRLESPSAKQGRRRANSKATEDFTKHFGKGVTPTHNIAYYHTATANTHNPFFLRITDFGFTSASITVTTRRLAINLDFFRPFG